MKKLNFGCGNKIKEGWVNVDIQKGPCIDKSFDFYDSVYPFKDNTFDYVLIDNVLEHLRDPHLVIKKLWKICKKDATIEIIVPYYNSYHAYSDPTHVVFFNEDCIRYTILNLLYEDSEAKEKFEITELVSVPQRFLKWVPMKFLNVMKRFFNNVVVELRVKARVIK